MALHLLNGEQNEHVNVHEESGLIVSDVLGVLENRAGIKGKNSCQSLDWRGNTNKKGKRREYAFSINEGVVIEIRC